LRISAWTGDARDTRPQPDSVPVRNTAVAVVSDIGRGRPGDIRSNNGLEFAAARFQDWRQCVGIQTIRI